MGCQPVQELTPRTSSLDETEEEPDQDSTHSVRSLHTRCQSVRRKALKQKLSDSEGPNSITRTKMKPPRGSRSIGQLQLTRQHGLNLMRISTQSWK